MQGLPMRCGSTEAAALLLLAQVETEEQVCRGRLVVCGAGLVAKGKIERAALEVVHGVH
jgi:hypothetical protein